MAKTVRVASIVLQDCKAVNKLTSISQSACHNLTPSSRKIIQDALYDTPPDNARSHNAQQRTEFSNYENLGQLDH